MRFVLLFRNGFLPCPIAIAAPQMGQQHDGYTHISIYTFRLTHTLAYSAKGAHGDAVAI